MGNLRQLTRLQGHKAYDQFRGTRSRVCPPQFIRGGQGRKWPALIGQELIKKIYTTILSDDVVY